MADYINKNNIKNITEYPNSFKRQGNFPLELESVQPTYNDAVTYAKGTTTGSYVGQHLYVVDNSDGNRGTYRIIDTAGNLEKLSSQIDLSNVEKELQQEIEKVKTSLETKIALIEAGGGTITTQAVGVSSANLVFETIDDLTNWILPRDSVNICPPPNEGVLHSSSDLNVLCTHNFDGTFNISAKSTDDATNAEILTQLEIAIVSVDNQKTNYINCSDAIYAYKVTNGNGAYTPISGNYVTGADAIAFIIEGITDGYELINGYVQVTEEINEEEFIPYGPVRNNNLISINNTNIPSYDNNVAPNGTGLFISGGNSDEASLDRILYNGSCFKLEAIDPVARKKIDDYVLQATENIYGDAEDGSEEYTLDKYSNYVDDTTKDYVGDKLATVKFVQQSVDATLEAVNEILKGLVDGTL